MAKKLKKQIKRSIPYFMIFSLIMSTAVMGLVFNFDLGVRNFSNHFGWNILRPEVNAQNDTATTSVTVRNAPPVITIEVAETYNGGNGSTSTSPVNVGDSIGFSVTATDVESNDYYLLVCSANLTPTPHNGAAPTCNVGATTFCVSGATATGNQATCTYNNVADPSAETEDWYAWVCDNHASQADCRTTVSQGSAPGSAATSSPFFVNHRPVLNAATTSIDFQLPGNNPFQFTATTTDTDVTGGNDVIQLDICRTNSWATSTFGTSGCAANQNICTATSTANGASAIAISCTATTTIPTADTAYQYYVYIQDWHVFSGTGNGANRQYHVANATPVLSGIMLNSDNPITLEMRFDPEYVSSTTVDVTDNNGCTDLSYATSSIYLSTLNSSCGADDDNCYQIANTSCAVDAGTCTGATDPDATYTCTTTMAFHTIPTDNSSNNNNETNKWLAGIRLFDNNGANSEATTTVPQGVEVITLQALTVTETSIPYGTVKGSENTGNYNATTTVVNYGNCPIDTGISGTDMSDGGVNVIEIANQKFDVNTGNYSALTYNASAISFTLTDVVIVKPTSGTQNVQDSIYWGIQIPGGKPSGDYYGTNTFAAELDDALPW